MRIRKLTLGLMTLAALSACSTHTPIETNQEYQANAPASISELTILSGDKRMPGIIYQAAGVGPHPTAIMLHGYPGNEKNLDVAQKLRSAGWNTIYFNYRGAWGAEGEFSFLNAEQDVQTVIDYARSDDSAKRFNINADKVSLVGHSMGGHMAVSGILDNQNVKCAVSHDGANLAAGGKGLFEDDASIQLWKDYGDSLYMLNGWSGQKGITEVSENGTRLDLLNRASQIGLRHTLFIAADTEVIPVDLHIKPLYKALNKASGGNSEYLLIDDDHSFSNTRKELGNATLAFLDKHCR